MKKNFKEFIIVVVLFAAIFDFAAMSLDAITTCMQIFGKTCANGGCRDFDWGDDCILFCTNRIGVEVTITCD